VFLLCSCGKPDLIQTYPQDVHRRFPDQKGRAASAVTDGAQWFLIVCRSYGPQDVLSIGSRNSSTRNLRSARHRLDSV